MPYPLPSEHERRALFAWLKQASSLSAWRRLHAYHQRFVDTVESVYEEEQRTPGATPTIPTDWYSDLLRDHDAFGGALDRLQRGDRRCFTFLGARGHFSQAITSVTWWQDMYGGHFYGRNGFGPEESPRWPELEQAMHDCVAALTDIGVVLQPQHTDVPAPIYSMETYLVHGRGSSLIKQLVAQPALAPLPEPTRELLVRSGQSIPCYGVWEPVDVPRAGGFFAAARQPVAPPGGFPREGCVNYLCADADAPTIAFPEDNQRREGRKTTWRLIWEDQRYGPNPLPVEEQSYVFVRPVAGEQLFRYV